MNEKLIKELSAKAIEEVCSKRTLKDGQIERVWNPHAYDLAFARLLIEEAVKKMQNEWDGDSLDDICKQLKQHFGVKDEQVY